MDMENKIQRFYWILIPIILLLVMFFSAGDVFALSDGWVSIDGCSVSNGNLSFNGRGAGYTNLAQMCSQDRLCTHMYTHGDVVDVEYEIAGSPWNNLSYPGEWQITVQGLSHDCDGAGCGGCFCEKQERITFFKGGIDVSDYSPGTYTVGVRAVSNPRGVWVSDSCTFTVSAPPIQNCSDCGDGSWNCVGTDNKHCQDNGNMTVEEFVYENECRTDRPVNSDTHVFCTGGSWYACDAAPTWTNSNLSGGQYAGSSGRCCDPSQSGADRWSYCGDGNVNTVCGEECESGVCCDTNTCKFKSSSNSCASGTDYRCSVDDCGADYQKQDWTRYCSGGASSCSGSISRGNWTTIEDCNDGERCYVSGTHCQADVCCTNTPPNVPNLNTPLAEWLNYNPNFKADVSDPDGQNVWGLFNITNVVVDGVGKAFSGSGTSCYPYSAPNCTNLNLDDGVYTWAVRAEDSSGCFNRYSALTPYRWLGIDKTAPNCDSMTHLPLVPDENDQVTFTVNASDETSGVASIQIFVDGVLRKTCPSSTICSYLGGPYPAGSHTYSANVIDNAGNTDSTPCSGTFDVEVLGVSVDLTANPNFGPPGFTSTLTADVSGTAEGDIIYEFDCHGNGYNPAEGDFTITTGLESYPYDCTYPDTSGKLYTAKVTVTREGLPAEDTENLYISTLDITPNPAGVTLGGTIQFAANYDADGPAGSGSSSNVASSANWSSDDIGVATINSSGLASGAGIGSTIITGTYSGLSDTADINVAPRVSSYRVVIGNLNRAPTVENLDVDPPPDWCTTQPAYSFKWDYTDLDNDTESRFDFRVYDDSTGGLMVDRSYSGLSYANGTQNKQSVSEVVNFSPHPPPSDVIGYDGTYSWQARVWDANGADSGWINGPGLVFTEPHRYPVCDFTWSPSTPNPGEGTRFTDNSTCYDTATGGASECCADITNPACNDSFSWDFVVGNPSPSNIENPVTTFTNSGDQTATLRVTDSDPSGNYWCEVTKTIRVNLPLPKWKEIIPF